MFSDKFVFAFISCDSDSSFDYAICTLVTAQRHM